MTEPRGGPTGGGTSPDRGSKSSGSGAEYAGLGVQFGGAIVLFAFLGWWLDARLGTSPWLLLLLVFVGAGGAFYSIYRKVMGTGTKGGTTAGTTTGGATPPDREPKR